MSCTPFEKKDGPFPIQGFVCTRGARRPQPKLCGQPNCAWPAPFLCDFSISMIKSCDERLCYKHAIEVNRDRHYCPKHKEEVKMKLEVPDTPDLFGPGER